MEPILIKKIKITVETTTDDGSKSALVFDMIPSSFQMSQSRDVSPLYDNLNGLSFGQPSGFSVSPTSFLNISGCVISPGVKPTEKKQEDKRPYWAGKDIVGALIRRGWRIADDGMEKSVGGARFRIHRADIMSWVGGVEEGAERLEHIAAVVMK